MPDAFKTGGIGPILKPVKVSYNPTTGLNLHLDWEAAGDGVIGLMNGLIASKTAFEADYSAHRSHLSATVTEGGSGFPDVATDHWQLAANEIQKDIKEAPAVVAMEIATRGSLAQVLEAVDNFNSGSTSDPGFTGTQLALYDYMKHGGTHYALGQYVLRWTTYVSFSSTEFRSEGAREALYTTAQVLGEANPPAGIANQMTSIASPEAVDGYLWSWRRVPSTRTTQAGNRIEIATEYWLDQWSTFVYALA